MEHLCDPINYPAKILAQGLTAISLRMNGMKDGTH
jgi:hypothetical protein